MFIFLAKTLDLLLSPLSWSILLILAAMQQWRRRPRLSFGLKACALAVLLAFSSPMVANRLAEYTESDAVSTFQPKIEYDAVIVLGGGLDPEATARSKNPEYNAAADRILRGFELLRSGHARNVLISAGSLETRPDRVIEANVLAKQLESWGIEPERIVTEKESRNTRENAVESAKIIQTRKWKTLLLVTSAAHMPRALGCFNAVGLNPDILPVDFRSTPRQPTPNGLVPRTNCLDGSASYLRELFGRMVYRLMGFSSNRKP